MAKPAVDAEAFGRHLKAALVLADRTVSEFAAEVGPDLEISAATIERVVQGRRAPRSWEVKRFAEALSVPEWFLLEGLGPEVDQPPARANEQRLEAIERKLKELPATIVMALGADPEAESERPGSEPGARRPAAKRRGARDAPS